MKFPEAVLNIEVYQQKIRHLLQDDECIIFLDTNIFARYYSLHATARQEFSNWSRPLIAQGRIKIPVWVLHEYTNRFINQKTQDYFGPVNQLKTIVKEFAHIKDFLTMSTAVTEVGFISDLISLQQLLGDVYRVAKDKNGDHIAIHNELETLFKTAVLKSDIEQLIQRANQCGQARYEQKIPPGFEDSSKSLNSLGDLIIWYEILEYSKLNDIKKVIFLTNDNKKDWMYKPPMILHEARRIPNIEPHKVADPRLVHEFSISTGSDEFYIIDFKMLSKALIASGGRGYMNMAAALQIPFGKTEDESNVDDEMSDSEMGDIEMESNNEGPDVSSSELSTADITEALTIEEHFEIQKINDPIELGEFNRIDIGQYIEFESTISSIILDLNEYDWYTQNDAVTSLNHVNLNTLPRTILTRNHLFHLGIALYESACGGGWKAADYMRNLQYELSQLDNFTATFIISGMLHEMYFNSKNMFRYDDLKSTFVEELLSFQTEVKVKNAIEFIGELLRPFEENILMIPSTEPEHVEITISYTVFKHVDNPIIDETNIIEDIQCEGKSLIYTVETRWNNYTLSGHISEIEERLSIFFAVPQDLLTIQYSPQPPKPNTYFQLINTKSLGINGHGYQETNLDDF